MARRKDLATLSLDHLRRVVQAIHTHSVAIETATGLTGPQFWALREVARAREGLSVGELARRLALHKANAGRLADRLAQKRLVTRETPPDDRRVVLVRVTAAGLRKAELPVSVPPQARLLATLEALAPGELASIEATLRRLVTLMGADVSLEPPMMFDAEAPTRPPAAARGARRPARRRSPAAAPPRRGPRR